MAFRPSLPATATLAALAVLFTWLGDWQLQRAGEKQAVLSDFASAPSLSALQQPSNGLRFARLTVAGSFDRDRHIMVDNRVHRGRAGVHVLTPLRTPDGILLVNRGWLPIPPDRRSLPPVSTPEGLLRVSGILDRLAPPGRKLGASDRLSSDAWPQLVTYPEPDAIAAALGAELYPLVLLLDADSPGGFADRDWQPVVMTPDRHRGYALQWFALAATAAVAWLLLGWRRGHLPLEGSRS